jgi:Phosphodiester glycosidase
VRRHSAALLLLLTALPASAEWRVLSARNEAVAAPDVVYRHVDLADSETGDRAIVDLAIFSTKSCALRVIDNPGGDKNLADAMEQSKCLAGVNGGYFDPNFAPIGLRIIDGRLVSPLLRARLLTGVLTSSGRGIQIVRLSEFSRREKLDAAIECGPMIVDLGAKVRGLDDTRLARRSFVAIDRNDRGALGFCSEASLAGLARILAGQFVADFKIQRALNLDGGSSSAFWFKRKDGSVFSISEQKSVRDFVGVVPR